MVLDVSVPEGVIKWEEIRVGRQLGSGGFGVVYAATWNHDDVAVKKVPMYNIGIHTLHRSNQL